MREQKNIEQELKAMKVVHDALIELPPDLQCNVVSWVLRRLAAGHMEHAQDLFDEAKRSEEANASDPQASDEG